MVAGVDDLMRQRWGVLLSIDDLVAGLHKAVADAGLLEETYFLFSSDHGCESTPPLQHTKHARTHHPPPPPSPLQLRLIERVSFPSPRPHLA